MLISGSEISWKMMPETTTTAKASLKTATAAACPPKVSLKMTLMNPFETLHNAPLKWRTMKVKVNSPDFRQSRFSDASTAISLTTSRCQNKLTKPRQSETERLCLHNSFLTLSRPTEEQQPLRWVMAYFSLFASLHHFGRLLYLNLFQNRLD